MLTCGDDGNYEEWEFRSTSTDDYLYNLGSDLCLDGRATAVKMLTCGEDQSYQEWYAPYPTGIIGFTDEEMYLETVGGSLCLDGRAVAVTMLTCGEDLDYQLWYNPFVIETSAIKATPSH
jgi:hypothetical protein